jgi:flap endonuclease-1
MDLQATLEVHDITYEQLIDIAILCGTDFNDGVRGYGPKTSVKAIKEHGDLWALIEAEDIHVENADRIRELFRDPPVAETPDLDLDLAPDVAAARAFVVDTWEVDADEVARGFDRIEQSVVQTGLDRWS